MAFVTLERKGAVGVITMDRPEALNALNDQVLRDLDAVLDQLEQDPEILVAIVTGADTKRIILKHLIPNCMGPIIIDLTFSIPSAIFTEASLSYLGMGIPVPLASWGTLANDGANMLLLYPYQLFFPALLISLTMLGFNLLGDGLRDALDPRLRR